MEGGVKVDGKKEDSETERQMHVVQPVVRAQFIICHHNTLFVWLFVACSLASTLTIKCKVASARLIQIGLFKFQLKNLKDLFIHPTFTKIFQCTKLGTIQ